MKIHTDKNELAQSLNKKVKFAFVILFIISFFLKNNNSTPVYLFLILAILFTLNFLLVGYIAYIVWNNQTKIPNTSKGDNILSFIANAVFAFHCYSLFFNQE